MDSSVFLKIGFTPTETKVYLSLLSIGATTAGKLVSETGCHRKNLYDALNKLMQKGLVTCVVEGRVKFFQAKDPENLLRFIAEQKVQLALKENEVKKLLPELQKKHSLQPAEIEAEIYRGENGIKTILKECLKYNEVLLIGATGDVENRLPFFWPQYNKQREKAKILWRLLLSNAARHKKITKSKFYSFKVLPKELSGPHVIYIYGNCIANVLWLEKPIAFVVKHSSLASSYKRYFEFLWKMLK